MSDKTETPRTDAAWHPARIADNGVASVMEEMKSLERELTQWREVAGRLADELKRLQPLLGEVDYPITEAVIESYDAMAKLSEEV